MSRINHTKTAFRRLLYDLHLLKQMYYQDQIVQRRDKVIKPSTQTLSWNGRKVTLTTQRMFGRYISVTSQVEESRIPYRGKVPTRNLIDKIIADVSLRRKTVTQYSGHSSLGWYLQVQTNKRLTDKQVSMFLGQLYVRHSFH